MSLPMLVPDTQNFTFDPNLTYLSVEFEIRSNLVKNLPYFLTKISNNIGTSDIFNNIFLIINFVPVIVVSLPTQLFERSKKALNSGIVFVR